MLDTPRFDRPSCVMAMFGCCGDFGLVNLVRYDTANGKYTMLANLGQGGYFKTSLAVDLKSHDQSNPHDCFGAVHYYIDIASFELSVPGVPFLDVAALRREIASQLEIAIDMLGVGWEMRPQEKGPSQSTLFVILNDHSIDVLKGLRDALWTRFGREQVMEKAY